MDFMVLERLNVDGKEVVLLGTAHVSAESVALVKETIEKEHPDVVGVELCQQRYKQLKAGDKWGEQNVVELIQTGKTYVFLINLLLANFQRRIGQDLGVKPGQEMLEAALAAESQGVKVGLMDRDVRITLRRAVAKMGLMEKAKFGYSLIMGFFGGQEGEVLTPAKIEDLKKKDVMSQLMEELAREMPSIKRVLVDERDAYIAEKIKLAPGKKVVAVVGAGHMEGIKKHLSNGNEVSVRSLEQVPQKKNYWGYLKYIVPILFAAILIYGFVAKGWEASLYVFLWWFLINGALSALGVLLARGSLYAVSAAFLAAPFTSLHPFFAAGWFAGLAQARVSMPKVKDFEGLRQLNSYSDFANNAVTKILLVTAFANLGSTIGTVVALPYVLSLLA